jgi:hypothetical protein
MKNLNMIGIVFNNFYLNELIHQKGTLRNKELLKIVKTIQERSKRISMISFAPGADDEDFRAESRLVSLWYENARYDNLHRPELVIASAEKYDDNTLILGDEYKLAIHFYDLKTHSVTKVFSATVEGLEKSSRPGYSMNNEGREYYGGIGTILVINKDTVAGIHHNGKNGCIIVIWDIKKGEVVKVIHEPSTTSYCTGDKGEVYYMPAKGVIRYLNLMNGDTRDYTIHENESNFINRVYYLTKKYLLLQYSNKQAHKMMLYELLSDNLKMVREKEGEVFRPLVINDNEFIYVAGNHDMLVYNFTEGRDTLPFKFDKDDDYSGDKEYETTDYIKHKETDIISTNDIFEIRFWDICNRKCKRVIPSTFPCWMIVSYTDDSFITLSEPHSHSYLQVWNIKELDLYPVLLNNYFIYDFVILNKNIIAVLTEEGIEIWDINTQKLVRYFPRDMYSLTRIDRINPHLFVCSFYSDGEGDTLYLYDYRKENCIREIDKGFNSNLLAILDDRYIAYIGEDMKIVVYDTKELKVEKMIMSPLSEDDIYDWDLTIVSKDRVALLTDSSLVYIIDWKKGKLEYSVDTKIKLNESKHFYCFHLYYFDENMLLLIGNDDRVRLDTTTKSMTIVDAKGDGSSAYIPEYKSIISNKTLALTFGVNVVKINHY